MYTADRDLEREQIKAFDAIPVAAIQMLSPAGAAKNYTSDRRIQFKTATRDSNGDYTLTAEYHTFPFDHAGAYKLVEFYVYDRANNDLRIGDLDNVSVVVQPA